MALKSCLSNHVHVLITDVWMTASPRHWWDSSTSYVLLASSSTSVKCLSIQQVRSSNMQQYCLGLHKGFWWAFVLIGRTLDYDFLYPTADGIMHWSFRFLLSDRTCESLSSEYLLVVDILICLSMVVVSIKARWMTHAFADTCTS